MMEYFSVLILPLMAAIIAATVSRPNLRDGAQLLLACLLVWRAAALLQSLMHRTLEPLTLLEPLPGIALYFEADGFGCLFLLLVAVLWAVSLLYSIGYLRANKELHQGKFYVWYAVAIAATSGIAISGNMVTLFLFYELLTLSTYPLVTHRGTEEARHAGRTYLYLLLSTSALLLAAIVWTQSIAGTTQFYATGLLAGKISPSVTAGLLLLYMYGIGKVALMPFHRWLPAAMVAPVPVSALLHAVAVVKVGAFTAIKVIASIFGAEHLRSMAELHWWACGWLTCIAGVTLILSSVIALRQDDLKRMLAYSTISQLALIVLSASLFTGIGFLLAAFHLAAHAFGKITLFFAAGSITTVTGKARISQLGGIGRSMPWTMAAFTVGALSMIGLFPAAGFYLKYALLHGTNSSPGVSVLLWCSLILNAWYFLPILHAAFFLKKKKRSPRKEAPLPMLLATCICALLSVLPCIFLWSTSAPVPLPEFPQLLVVTGLPWLVAAGAYAARIYLGKQPAIVQLGHVMFHVCDVVERTYSRAAQLLAIRIQHCLRVCTGSGGIGTTLVYTGIMLALLLAWCF